MEEQKTDYISHFRQTLNGLPPETVVKINGREYTKDGETHFKTLIGGFWGWIPLQEFETAFTHKQNELIVVKLGEVKKYI